MTGSPAPTAPPVVEHMDCIERVERELVGARARTMALLEPLSDVHLRQQHSPLMSPLLWDLAHIGNYEEQWLVRALGGSGLGPEHDDIYDAFRHPRRDRPTWRCSDPRRRVVICMTFASEPSTCSGEPPSTAGDPSSTTGSCTAWSSSTSTSTSRRCWRRCSSWLRPGYRPSLIEPEARAAQPVGAPLPGVRLRCWSTAGHS